MNPVTIPAKFEVRS